MKKMIICMLLICFCFFTLCTCSARESDEYNLSDTRFKVVYTFEAGDNTTKDGLMTRIIVDTETGVMYLYASGVQRGGLTVLVDEDGKPLIWDEYERN